MSSGNTFASEELLHEKVSTFYLQLHPLIASRGKDSHLFVLLLIDLNRITQPRCKKAPED